MDHHVTHTANFGTTLQHAGAQFRVGTGLVGATESSVTFQVPVGETPVYARLSNTVNHKEVTTLLAKLHGGEEALVFGSGMAAFSAVMLTYLRPGDEILVQKNCYGGAILFYKHVLEPLGILVRYVDIQGLEKAISQKTKMVHFESITNPFCTPHNLAEIATLSRKYKLLSVCDNTFASPYNCQPLAWGIDFALESATKYLNGHSDVICGMVAGSKQLLEPIAQVAKSLGGFLPAPFCMQLLRGLRTLHVRMDRHNENGAAFANYMGERPYVKQVYYGAPSNDPVHRYFPRGFGGVCTVRFAAEVDVPRLMKSFKIIKDVPSLAGTETTATMPYFSTHYYASEEEKKSLDIDKQVVRFSVGLEHLPDVLQDIEQAL